MIRLAAAIVAGGLLLVSCSVSPRPEGILERWFREIDQGRVAEVDDFGDPSLVDAILSEEPEEDEDDVLGAMEFGEAEVDGDRARVPFRVELNKGGEAAGIAEMERDGQRWTILAISEPDASLRVPSEGGERPGGITPFFWAVALSIALGLTLITVIVMRLFGGDKPAG